MYERVLTVSYLDQNANACWSSDNNPSRWEIIDKSIGSDIFQMNSDRLTI